MIDENRILFEPNIFQDDDEATSRLKQVRPKSYIILHFVTTHDLDLVLWCAC
jgi:hypothetical protein